MRKTIITSFTFLAVVSVFGFKIVTDVIGKQFPDLNGTTIDDKKVTLPAGVKGKQTLLCLAFSKDAEADLKTWLEPTYDKFIAQTQLVPYDINLYFIPMFTGLKAATADAAKNKLKTDIDNQLHPYILIYKGDLDKYYKDLQLTKENVPYIFVLDAEGKIIYTTSGAYTDEKMDAIEDKLD